MGKTTLSWKGDVRVIGTMFMAVFELAFQPVSGFGKYGARFDIA